MKKDDMIWGFMIQLGHNMWGEAPLVGEPTEENRDKYAQPFNRTDVKVWNEVTECYAKKGANLVLIDLGEGVAYPSHPELAVEGSWSPERMKEEIARLRGLGLEPIPKLNFSACHDAWLKEYSRMIATPEYYKVCADLIRDVCEIFEKPRLFHLGWDEERMGAQRGSRYAVSRQGELWWHDMLFTAQEVEKHGSRPWIWSVMQCPWHYERFWHFVRDNDEIRRRDWPEGVAGALAFKELSEGGYDMIPCGSTWAKKWNMATMVRFSKKHLKHKLIKGFLMASWMRTCGENDIVKHREAAECLAEAKEAWYDNRHEEDLVLYGPVGKCVEACIPARRKEGREPVVVTPDKNPPEDMPYFDFMVRDALIDIRWGEKVVSVDKEGDVTFVRLSSGKAIKCKTFKSVE